MRAFYDDEHHPPADWHRRRAPRWVSREEERQHFLATACADSLPFGAEASNRGDYDTMQRSRAAPTARRAGARSIALKDTGPWPGECGDACAKFLGRRNAREWCTAGNLRELNERPCVVKE